MSAITAPSPPPSRTRWRAAPGRWLSPAASNALGLVLLLISLGVAASHGAFALGWREVLQLGALWWQGQPTSGEDPLWAGAQVFWHIRAPRLAMGLLAGAALGLSGALVQGLFRNPLADPGLIGVNAGAALGAAGFIVLLPLLGAATVGFQLGLWGVAGAMLSAFALSLLTTALVWRLARQHGQVAVTRLLLVGVAVNALAGSGLGLLSHLATDSQLRALSFWMLGSLAPSHWLAVACVLPAVLLSALLCVTLPASLNTLSLGEAQARLSGVDVLRLQRRCVALAALSVGSVTAVIGMVGFIGLLAPHAVRLLTGPDHRAVLPGSALLGASLVLLADTVARTAFAPVELPLGVLTGLIGAPTFLWLLRQRSHAAT
ncbi:MAG: iron ABC transporter permease [Burkholderiales bacterium]|nr:iron ABC transporter permease [Burkholderiales bacterium]